MVRRELEMALESWVLVLGWRAAGRRGLQGKMWIIRIRIIGRGQDGIVGVLSKLVFDVQRSEISFVFLLVWSWPLVLVCRNKGTSSAGAGTWSNWSKQGGISWGARGNTGLQQHRGSFCMGPEENV